MQYTYLGRSGLRVSRLCLGTMNFGTFTEEKECFRIMDAALDAGINFFDTANNYGFFMNRMGITEEIMGRWFKQGGGRRERVVLATKVHEVMGSPYDGPNDVKGLSAYKIRRHFEDSLRRLQTDHVEIYFMHHIDRRTPWEELWGALIPLVESGRVDYIASSNFAGWHMAQAQAAARERKFLGLVCEEHRYNLLCRLPELEVLPSARAHGIGVVTWGPLQGGLLSRDALKTGADGRITMQNTDLEKHRGKLEAFAALSGELGVPQDNIALAWLLANPAVTAPIVGPMQASHLTDALPALDVKLSDDVMKRLDGIFPGPGGEVPEAYAW